MTPRRSFKGTIGTLICAVLVFILAAAAQSIADQIKITYDFAAPLVQTVEIDGQQFSEVTMPGCPPSGTIGGPALPTKRARVLLPYGYGVKSVTVNRTRKHLVDGVDVSALDAAVAADSQNWISGVNLEVVGDFLAYGEVSSIGHRNHLDTGNLYCRLPDTILQIRMPDHYWGPADSTDSFCQVHPSIQYFPQQYKGWSYWIATTPYDAGLLHENICLYVTNDIWGEWKEYWWGTDSITDSCGYHDSTLHNPVFSNAADTAHRGTGDTGIFLYKIEDGDTVHMCIFTSDPHLSTDANGEMWVIFRGTYCYTDKADTTIVYASHIDSIIAGQHPIQIFKTNGDTVHIGSADSLLEAFISPSAWLHDINTVRLAALHKDQYPGGDGDSINEIVIYESGTYAEDWIVDTVVIGSDSFFLPRDTLWYVVDTAKMRWSFEDSTYDFWHFSIRRIARNYLVILASSATINGETWADYIAIGESFDGGKNFTIREQPLLREGRAMPRGTEKGHSVRSFYRPDFFVIGDGRLGIVTSIVLDTNAVWGGWTEIAYMETFNYYGDTLQRVVIDCQPPYPVNTPNDSVWQSFEYTDGQIPFIVKDSCLKTVASGDTLLDTLRFVGTAPCDMYLDSIIINFKGGAGDAAKTMIYDTYIYGPARTSGYVNAAFNVSQGLWWYSSKASGSANYTRWARIMSDSIPSLPTVTWRGPPRAYAGDRWQVRIRIGFTNDVGGTVEIAAVQIIGHRNWKFIGTGIAPSGAQY